MTTAANATPNPAELIAEALEQYRNVKRSGLGTNTTEDMLATALQGVLALLTEAPHAPGCHARHYSNRTAEHLCDCWKSKLPADALAARDARVAATALRYAAYKMIDWEVVYGHEEGTPEQRESNSNAAWLHSEADRIEREAQ